jgi:hypothetical protein
MGGLSWMGGLLWMGKEINETRDFISRETERKMCVLLYEF